METLLQDLRYALRMMRNKPGFAAVALLTLALGIGVNTAVFSIVNTLLLHRMPVEQPDQLVNVYMGTSHTSYLNYRDISESLDPSGLFSGMAAHRTQEFNVGQGEGARRAWGEVVTGTYFPLLGVQPLRGRLFGSDTDSMRGGPPVVVISYRYWKRNFQLRDDIIGSQIVVNGHTLTVIGITPEPFAGTYAFLIKPDMYVPLSLYTTLVPDRAALESRGRMLLELVGRRKPGVSIGQAQAALATVATRLEKSYPVENSTFKYAVLYPMHGLGAFRGMSFAPVIFAFLGLMFALVGTVLLIACANLANLLLARSWTRRKEVALRVALGANRTRILRQLLTESLLLAVLGGAAGCALAKVLVEAAGRFQPPVPIPVEFNFAIDWRVLLYASGLSMITGVLFGLAPAWHAAKADVLPVIKAGGSQEPGGAQRWRFRNVLVAGQVAGSLVLLVCTGLFARSLQRLTAADPGFQVNNVVNAEVDLRAAGFDDTRGPLLYENILERARSMAGVQDATLASIIPLTMNVSENPYQPEGRGEGDTLQSYINTVAPRYFSTLNIPLIAGRDFTADDKATTQPVAIINQTFAQKVWPGQSALGKRVRTLSRPGQWESWSEVIAVVADTKYRSPGEEPAPLVYRPLAQVYDPHMTLQVRINGDPNAFQPVLRSTLTTLDSRLLVHTSTFKSDVALSLLPPRIAAVLLGILGTLGLLLATLGLYGLISFLAMRRTREMGVRIALGARPRDIFRLILGQGVKLALTGACFGLVVAMAVTLLLSKIITSLNPMDPMTYGAVLLVLMGVAFAASYFPARRALKTDPIEALRIE